MGFRDIPRPFVCCVLIDDPTVPGAIKTLKLGEYEGADAFDLELQGLDPDQRTPQALRPLFEATTKPIYTVYRRYTFHRAERVRTEKDDLDRMHRQLDLIALGSLGFDMELDTFDPQPGPPSNTPEGKRYNYDRSSPPREITIDPRAVEQQVRIVEEAHRRGGEVMFSTHNSTRLSPEGALAMGRLAEERGGDAVKIVQFCANDEDVVEALASTIRLKRELTIPFAFMAMGEYGKLTRIIAPLLGSMLVFARHDYGLPTYVEQPPVRAMKAFFANADFRITRHAQDFLPEKLQDAVADAVFQ